MGKSTDKREIVSFPNFLNFDSTNFCQAPGPGPSQVQSGPVRSIQVQSGPGQVQSGPVQFRSSQVLTWTWTWTKHKDLG